ncbi:TPM domain-containing protein [Bacteriovoracales bacterium]|nr:TPM domain-containing protein [Bacteriovoracales bacterium]
MELLREDKIKIEQAIKTVESTTSGEIVPAIFTQSDFYPASHFRLAITIGILIPTLSLLTEWPEGPGSILWLQLPGLVLGYYLAYIPTLKRWFSTKKEIAEEVHQRALQAFFENNLHTTKDRTGILIMVSALEHRVEILADKGINDKVEVETWNKILTPFIDQIKNDQLIDGLVDTIVECGKVLTEYFPIKSDDRNELSNKIVTDKS